METSVCYYCCLPLSSTPCESCGGKEVEEHPLFLQPGTVLEGKYILGRVLGHGGFGVTYLAYDGNLQMRVAIKEFLPNELATRDQRTMAVSPFDGERAVFFQEHLNKFLEEARTLGKFRHQAVVSVLSYFRENATGYMIMDYLEGEDLEEMRQSQGGTLSISEVKPLLQETLEGLQYVHDQNMLHRDIKPANLMMTKQGQLTLLDFGSARQLNHGDAPLTQLWTPGFAPPEQSGNDDHAQGPWTDVYAVGATFYTLLVGNPPPDIVQRLQGTPLFDFFLGEPALQSCLEKALQLHPSKRFQTASEMLEAVREGEVLSTDTQEPHTSPKKEEALVSSPERTTQRPAWTLPAMAVGGVLLFLLLLFFSSQGKNDNKEMSRRKKLAMKKKWEKKYSTLRSRLQALQKSTNSLKNQMKQRAKRREKRRVPVVKRKPAFRIPAKTRSEKDEWFETVFIQPGSFSMGSPRWETRRDSDEPLHRVVLTRGFWVMKTEVTQGVYKKVMGTNPSKFWGCGDKCPVEMVSWHNAAYFSNRLSRRDGLPTCFQCNYGQCEYRSSFKSSYHQCKGWRLPTEAEWEYFARAGAKGAIHTGSLGLRNKANAPALGRLAWYAGNSGVRYRGAYNCRRWRYRQYYASRCGPRPVGGKKPNAWGLYDTLGNVWEWVLDVETSYRRLPTTDPVNFDHGSKYVSRGGAWDDYAYYVRLANRDRRPATDKVKDVGFRLVRSK